MTFIQRTRDGLFLCKDGGYVSLLDLSLAWRFEVYVTASQEMMKLTEEHRTVSSYDLLLVVSRMNDLDKESVYKGGAKEMRERIKELNQEIKELKKVNEDLLRQVSGH